MSIATLIATLIALIAQLTGISRPVDPVLAALAQKRSAEVVTDWDHRYLYELDNGQWAGWGEVLGENRGYADPATAVAYGWLTSPEHWAILTNPDYTRIGCGVTHVVATGWYYFACIVARPAGPAPTPSPPPPPRQPPPPTEHPPSPAHAPPPSPVLPDTSVLKTY